MAIDTFTKQPSEEYYVTVDFSQVLGSTETIASVTCTVTELTVGTDMTATMAGTPTITGQTVKALMKAGTTGYAYDVSFRIVTSLSQKFEADLNMNVLEDV
jgi:hypothetical protein